MKKNLIGIIIISLILLCSCTGTPKKVTVTQSQNDNIITKSYDSVQSSKDTESTYQNFIGVWSTDELKTNQILIYEITEVTVKFNTGVNGLFGFDATGMLLDGEFVFGDGISPGYSGPDGVKGKLKFSNNSITVIYDDFGSLDDSDFYPMEYTFTIKEENSDEIISQYKSSIGY